MKLWTNFTLTWMMGLVLPVWADSGQCGFIKNPDAQANCRATTGSGSGQCGFIREPDLQAHCRSVTGGGSGPCGFIREPDRQEIGRAHV